MDYGRETRARHWRDAPRHPSVDDQEAACKLTDRVRRGNRVECRPRWKPYARRHVERRPTFVLPEIRRAGGAGRAVDVAELGTCLGDLGIRVPAASAEQGRPEPELPHPVALLQDALARAGAGRPCMIRRGPVGVVPQRTARSGLARPRHPHGLVLSEHRVRRAHERRDGEAPGPRLLQRREARPHRVVERSLNVAGHDRVPFPRRGAHRGRR